MYDIGLTKGTKYRNHVPTRTQYMHTIHAHNTHKHSPAHNHTQVYVCALTLLSTAAGRSKSASSMIPEPSTIKSSEARRRTPLSGW